MKLSISNIAWKQEHDEEMYQTCRDMGYSGIEIAPSRIFGEFPYHDMKVVDEYKKKMKEQYDLEISSIQSIWYGKRGFLFKEDYHELADYTCEALRFAGCIGAGNVVFGSPAMRRVFQPEDYQKGINFFSEISKWADKFNTVFSIEANPFIYGTNYINYTLEAMAIVKQINSEHLKVKLDIGTVIFNEESLEEIERNMDLIHHVHISEPHLVAIEKRQIHKELFQMLRDRKYDNYVSIEMKCQEKIDDIKRIMEYIFELSRQ